MRHETPPCSSCVSQTRRRCKTCDSPDLAPRSANKNGRPKAYRPYCTPCYNARQRELKRARGFYKPKSDAPSVSAVDKERTPRLDARPIVQWLQPHLKDRTLLEVADFLGVDDSGFSRLANGRRQYVHLDTVDKILCAFGATGTLRELYPHLYQFTPKQMMEAETWATEK